MKTLLLGAAALTLTAGAALALETVRLVSEVSYPPYIFINDNGEIDGFEIELGNILCERASLTCEWVTNEWDSIIPNLVSGNYDTIMAGMSITEDRDEVIDFTQNYYPPTVSRYAAMEEGVDLEGGVIAAQVNTIQAGYVAESGATLIEFATGDETIAAVRNGEADAVFADLDFLAPMVNETDLMFVGDGVPLRRGIGMRVRESDADLRETFDAVISEMKADGTLNALLIKWFGDDTQTYE